MEECTEKWYRELPESMRAMLRVEKTLIEMEKLKTRYREAKLAEDIEELKKSNKPTIVRGTSPNPLVGLN